MNLVGIKSDLTSQLATALSAYGVAGYRSPPSDADLPLFAVHPPDRTDYNRTFRRGAEIEMLLTLVVSKNENDHAHLLLDSAVSLVVASTEVATATESGDATNLLLPPIVPLINSFESIHWSSLYVVSHDRYREIDVGAVTGFGVDFTLAITTPGVPSA